MSCLGILFTISFCVLGLLAWASSDAWLDSISDAENDELPPEDRPRP